MKRLLLAGLLLLASCHQPSFAELVQTAANRWEKTICRQPRYNVIIVTPKLLYCGGVYRTDWYGCYTPSTGVLEIAAGVPPDRILQVLTHEIGHSISPGKHAADHAGIMSEYIGIADTYITTADIELLCEDYECPCRNPEKP